MAKRKHPAALFEVIHTTPPPPLKLSRARRSWWFGHRSDTSRPEMLRSMHPSMIADEPHPAALAAPPAPTPIAARPTSSPEAELRARFAEAESAQEVAVFSADEPEGQDMIDRRYFPSPRPAPAQAVTEYCAGGLRIDRDRQELTFRLKYTTAALVAFIGLVLMGLAFVVGKRAAEHSDDAAMEALRSSQPDPAVLNVDRSDNTGGQARTPLAAIDSGASTDAHTHDSAAAPAGPAAMAGPVQRTIGLDYIVVQSYPSENQKAAQDTADMLTAQGVPCTVEHGLRWAPNWYSVVTVAGYPPHSADGDKLAESIRKIAADQAKLGHRYRFEPQKYQWNQ